MIDALIAVFSTWNGKKPSKKYSIISQEIKDILYLAIECKKNKIKNLLLGHHLNDLV